MVGDFLPMALPEESPEAMRFRMRKERP
jgi:hypothetical protein